MSETPEPGSLAELTAIEYLNNMMSILSDEVSLLTALMNQYSTGTDIEKTYEKMRLIKQRGEETKIMLMEYLVKNSEVMMYSSSYIEMVRTIDRFIQHADSVAYRLVIASKNNIGIRGDLKSTLDSMLQRIRQQVDLIRDALAKLSTHPRRSIDHVDEVLKLEDDVDRVFRELIFKVYETYAGSVTGLMVLKDLIEYVEELSDLLKYLGEEIRYLALVKTVAK
ncbi:DUF47 domain-containing protein [Desulfurococcus mucosus]|uniref:Putative phosphate transport regulator n=1 Tax=Desulfurococcus mucosus (strain ATCC 35584 / DSM 2162 / JCM 9187 / O7/1) TaxID=765177 RepID=E8R7S6_DESM0|nr:DUF47 family protein [Desulfurococcus mucosus]ADV64552.1 putative phosphate transport regulator [Desulfurococcus mucosus DSM 2162]